MAKGDITFERYATAEDAKKAQAKKARKKPVKKATTKKPKQVTVNSTEYGYASLINDALRATALYGQPIPEDLEERVKYYKDKYEYSIKRNDILKEQVQLLQSIIDSALTRSCNGSC